MAGFYASIDTAANIGNKVTDRTVSAVDGTFANQLEICTISRALNRAFSVWREDNLKRFFLGLAAVVIGAASTLAVSAQDFPNKSITVVVPASAGGSSDVFTRLVAKEMSSAMGQTVLIENRPGGSNLVGAQYVANMPADGYTLLLGNGTLMSILPSMRKEMPIDIATAFEPVAFLVSYPMGLVVNAKNIKAGNLEEFRAEALEQNGEINMATIGLDSTSYLLSELYQQETGTELTPIPYAGDAEIVVALLNGEVDAGIVSLGTYKDHIKSGALKLLAVNTPERVGIFPEVPTFVESGLPKMSLPAWIAYFAPAGVPEAVVASLSKAINDALALPHVREQFVTSGAVPLILSPSELGNWVSSEREVWAGLIKDAGIEPK